MRNPNGINVRKLSGKRRKPYNVRKLIGYRVSEETRKAIPIYKSIGWYETRKAALEAAMEYEKDPLKFDVSEITFKELYDKFSEKKFKTIADSTVKNYKGGFKYFAPIHHRKFIELRALDYEAVITDDVPRTQQTVCKILLDQMYQYAMKNDICDKNIGKIVGFGKKTKTKLVRKLYTKEEIDLVKDRSAEMVFRVTLLCLYTGFRPGEASIVKKSKVFIEEGYIQEGNKTQAGRDRVVPIHDDLMPYIKAWMEEADKRKGDSLFILANGAPMNMHMYSKYFRDIMEELQWKHMPHDARHTFVTTAARCGMDDSIIKTIVGHKITDVTKSVYTHIELADMKDEMKKFKY